MTMTDDDRARTEQAQLDTLDREMAAQQVRDMLTLEGLASWLETQDPSTEYYYIDNQDCLVCRYLRSRGVDVFSVTPSYVNFRISPGDIVKVVLDPNVNDASMGFRVSDVSLYSLWDYGSALARTREKPDTSA